MPPFSLRRRLASFGYALAGARAMLATQPNAWIHLLATLGVLAAGIAFRLGPGEWAWLILAIALVGSAEAFNTALELLADEISLEKRERIRQAKDVAALGVLLSAIAAVAIGVRVFAPHLLRLH